MLNCPHLHLVIYPFCHHLHFFGPSFEVCRARGHHLSMLPLSIQQQASIETLLKTKSTDMMGCLFLGGAILHPGSLSMQLLQLPLQHLLCCRVFASPVVSQVIDKYVIQHVQHFYNKQHLLSSKQQCRRHCPQFGPNGLELLQHPGRSPVGHLLLARCLLDPLLQKGELVAEGSISLPLGSHLEVDGCIDPVMIFSTMAIGRLATGPCQCLLKKMKLQEGTGLALSQNLQPRRTACHFLEGLQDQMTKQGSLALLLLDLLPKGCPCSPLGFRGF